jgi:hypothetical protein
VVVGLCDVWEWSLEAVAQMWAWAPVDHEPMPAAVRERLEAARGAWAMSRFAEREMRAAGLQTVGARAAEGLPNAAGLTEELRAAIPALPQPQAPAAPDNSYLGSLMGSLSSIVNIRTIGDTDWPGVAGQALSFAEAGDLNQAIAVIDAAEGDKPMALVQWRDRAAARLQLEAALAEVSDAVLRQIAALGGGQQ